MVIVFMATITKICGMQILTEAQEMAALQGTHHLLT
jgi:hypothetical protein